MDNLLIFKRGFNKENREGKAEKIEKLKEICTKNGAPIDIIDYGENYDQEELDLYFSNQINKDQDEYSNTKRYLIMACKEYLNGLIFTDNSNNKKRNEIKGILLNNKDLLNLYTSNRIKNNKINTIIAPFLSLIELTDDYGLKNELKSLEAKIKKEIWPYVETAYYEGGEKGPNLFEALNNDEKVKLVKKFSEIIKEFINVLENKV